MTVELQIFPIPSYCVASLVSIFDQMDVATRAASIIASSVSDRSAELRCSKPFEDGSVADEHVCGRHSRFALAAAPSEHRLVGESQAVVNRIRFVEFWLSAHIP